MTHTTHTHTHTTHVTHTRHTRHDTHGHTYDTHTTRLHGTARHARGGVCLFQTATRPNWRSKWSGWSSDCRSRRMASKSTSRRPPRMVTCGSVTRMHGGRNTDDIAPAVIFLFFLS